MSQEIEVTIKFKYTSETEPDGGLTPLRIDEAAFNDGEFDIPEMLEWANDDIDVTFKEAS